MSADAPLEYWTPGASLPASAPGGGIFTGPHRAGCFAMLAVTLLAAALALGIVTGLGLLLG
jgi:hypothetical protein